MKKFMLFFVTIVVFVFGISTTTLAKPNELEQKMRKASDTYFTDKEEHFLFGSSVLEENEVVENGKYMLALVKYQTERDFLFRSVHREVVVFDIEKATVVTEGNIFATPEYKTFKDTYHDQTGTELQTRGPLIFIIAGLVLLYIVARGKSRREDRLASETPSI